MTPTDPWDPDGALRVTARLSIPAGELAISATRAGGPGGQHVNTSATRIEVVWRLLDSTVLSEAQRARLRERLASRLDSRGALRVVAADTRSQARNRELALARLAATVRAALAVPKPRRKTAPSRAVLARRADEKKRRSARKRDRRWKGEE
jgi:ribosome-associated protein